MSIRLLSDFVAIRPDPPTERRHGKIIIPQTVDMAADSGWIEEGTVVAVGPGDRFVESWPDPNGPMVRKLITVECPGCAGKGTRSLGAPWKDSGTLDVLCGCCQGRVPVTVPTPCQPGDRVLYVAGRSGTWHTIDGERCLVVHAEQFVIAVIEREAEVEKAA